MKKYILSLILVVCLHGLQAISLSDQLCAFNPNWKKYTGRIPDSKALYFYSDKEYIQAHLQNVLIILRSNPTAGFTTEQLKSRAHLTEVLDAYRIAGNFPINYYHKERIPVFIDENDTHCAVGYLLKETGNEKIARRIADADNYVWVKDIKDPELMTWQIASGFTLEELKLIQGAYDFYMPRAMELPNKYEIPQKPACILTYFQGKKEKPENIWLKGEGTNGVLNGNWEQNASAGMPWIVGFYEQGKRSGQWKEYYRGTKQICRTENWRDDKLNGIRKRYDREGNLIEEILFKDGNAITKTNYDLKDSLVWIRKPLDSVMVYTQVFTSGGSMIAAGHEKIYNPGNLLWFQNIELTALNSASITSKEVATASAPVSLLKYRRQDLYTGQVPLINLYNTPPLVEYKKEGTWTYYKDYSKKQTVVACSGQMKTLLYTNYSHFADKLNASLAAFDYYLNIKSGYDSLHVEYANDLLKNFYGYGKDYTHLQIRYYDPGTSRVIPQIQYGYNEYSYRLQPATKTIGQYNKVNEKIGEWRHFNPDGQLYKIETFILPKKEEEELTGL